MIVESAFKPAWWMKNCHLQTMLPKVLRRYLKPRFITEEVTTPDGDFIELCWTQKPAASTTTPIVIVFHGLEGNKESHYAAGMMDAIDKHGWIGCLMHFRSCGSRPNLLPRMYHSGDTEDAIFLLDRLANDFPHAPLSAVGYSLGGNMLCKLLGEQRQHSALKSGVIVSAPLDLSSSCERISQGSSRIYHKYLLDRLKKNLTRKWQQLDLSNLVKISRQHIMSIQGIREFDDKVTAPMHGFDDADHYYRSCSGNNFISNIVKPALFLHAMDDPFLSDAVVPRHIALPAPIRFEISEHGGHVGFISGNNPFRPEFWQEQRVLSFMAAQL